MQALFNFIKGIFIGIGAILPGISSGVICMVLGIYEKLIDSILNFFKNVKENLSFILPIFLGIAFGCILFSNILVYFFNNIPTPTKSLFIGLLLGSLYILYKTEIKNEYQILNQSYIYRYISFFICFLIGLFFIFFENHALISYEYAPNEYHFLFLVLSGFFMSLGIVVPRNK